MKTSRTPSEAYALASRHGFPLGLNFFTLSSSIVSLVLAAANEWKYRKPKNANGSRGRYFYAYLNRIAARKA